MKIKALSRSVEGNTRSNSGDIKKLSRNLDPKHKPLERAREYTRAVTSAKLERMFAKPFVAALEGHVDSVACSAASRGHLCPFVTGGVDGEIRVWDLASRRTVWNNKTSHTGAVNGVCISNDGKSFFSCSTDKTIKQWGLGVKMAGGRKEKRKRKEKGVLDSDSDSDGDSDSDSEVKKSSTSSDSSKNPAPLNSWLFSDTFKSMDHHWNEEQFTTASDEAVQVWSHHRSNPIQTYEPFNGTDSCNVVRWNPSERSLLAHTSSDRGIGLHDTRASSSLRKTVLRMRSNCLEWNPMEPMNFVVGNEDHNCYSFDMRKLSQPTMVHKGHVGAVLSIGWSSTGREFVTGSYDRTIRIFNYRSGTSRDSYYAKRMQRVFCVNYTADAKFIVSGSDDTNLRIWKARSNEKLGQQLVREERATNYRNTLVKKFEHMPEVRNIVKSRNMPKFVKKQTAMAQIQHASAKRKEGNIIKHSKKGSVAWKGERAKAIVKEYE
ncbi:hypothetical protein TrVE_jg7592 [Triparma verrucosa]|uniref:Sof1-like protein domain-containing protein n=1 Tax=Triparma verrucosa TaxID=1606542 RepID=A0A9W7FN39_9STRA|nr:hypothetical protein TrVE_jg7592 [Triparma verrucosa]